MYLLEMKTTFSGIVCSVRKDRRKGAARYIATAKMYRVFIKNDNPQNNGGGNKKALKYRHNFFS